MALYVVSTPIGNLSDLSPRAQKVLSEVDAVACEDTRHTGQLLSHCGIRKPMVRFDQHVHRRETPRLIERLRRGESVALVTDAGTPGVSDPGAPLIAAAVEAKIAVVPVPGPSAALTALAGEGEAEAILQCGCCDAYMAKPASLADIRAKVSELLHFSSRAA